MLRQGGRLDGFAVQQQQRDRLFPLQQQTRLSRAGIQLPSRPGSRSQHISSSRLAAAAVPANSTVYVQQPYPTQPTSPAAAAVPITWPGLLAALGLAATALFGLAATCFFLYIRPVMQAMSVTLAEMEAAAKEMQQAAQEVEELVGGVNSAIKLLMQPTALLKWTTSAGSSSNNPTASVSSPQSSTDEAGFADTSSGSSSAAGVAGVSSTGGSAARQLTDQLEVLAPSLLEGLRGLQRLQLSDLGAAALKMSGLDEAAGKQQEQRTRLRRAVQGPSISSSTSSSGMVWDMLASSAPRRATRRSLARLRSDLAAAANVLGVLLSPPSRSLYEQMQQQDEDASNQQQQQQQEEEEEGRAGRQAQASSIQPASALAARSPTAVSDNRISSGGSGRSDSSSASQQTSRGGRAVPVDEWGLPITAAELASVSDAAASDPATQQPPSSRQGAEAGATTASASISLLAQQQQQSDQQQQQSDKQQQQSDKQQQQQQHSGRRPSSAGAAMSSGDEDGWHLDLSHYGNYLEQEHSAVSSRTDSGITWQQLQQDASLMQRVFCDNQDFVFEQQLNKQQQQASPPQKQEEQQQPQQQQREP